MRPIAALALAMAASAGAQVTLRGGARIDAEVVAVNGEGVWTSSPDRRLLTWDIVRSVDGPLRAEAQLFEGIADDAWRARTRLERGDALLAEPLFERVLRQTEDGGGATALLAAEGLLRCRVWRASQRDAVEAWLRALELRERGAELPAHSFASGLDGSGLAPALPPVWDRESAASVEPFEGVGEGASARVRALRRLYEHAQRRDRLEGGPVPEVEEALRNDPAVALVLTMALAQSPDGAERERGRAELLRGIEREPGGWREGWRRAALGRSLIAEEDPATRRQGVLHLLRIPASGLGSGPLERIALREAADELERQGELDAAAVLRLEARTLEQPAIEGRS